MSTVENLGERLTAFEFKVPALPYALESTIDNWNHWKDCYEHTGAFSELPLFADFRIFQAFVYDFALNRTVKRGDLRRVWTNLHECDEPTSAEQLSVAIGGARQNFSMATKLLTLWRPERFYPLDTLNRKGLRSLFRDSGLSFAFTQAHTRSYDRLAQAFDILVAMDDRFAAVSTVLYSAIPDAYVARRRFIDNYFMAIGRGLGT